MKKQFLILGSLLLPLATMAQINNGGFPWSYQKSLNDYTPQFTHEYDLPNWEAFQAQLDTENSFNKPNVVALTTAVTISFPESGTFYHLPNGEKIWKAQVRIAGAKGMGFYLDKFNLPKGVSLYITNANKKHILGAYDYNNNNEFNNFAIEPIQGEYAAIELNIASGVQEEEIIFNIDKIATYFNSIAHLAQYDDTYQGEFIDSRDEYYYGNSSQCNINAICPLGAQYPLQKQAALQQLLITGNYVSSCSGTMINMVGNTQANCKQYYLTAGHCDSRNAKTDAAFSQLLLRFNYETKSCTNPTVPQSNTITGAKFVARSYVNGNSPNTIKGDFLLLLPSSKVPDSWGVNLAGWVNHENFAKTVSGNKRFINFSHPNGDVKKVAVSKSITNRSVGATGSHWYTKMANGEGIIEPGSSGSGFFNGDGLLIGIASTAGPNNVPANCSITHKNRQVASGAYNYINYAKFSYAWNYSKDGGANNTKLQPWLDPNNTGAKSVPIVTSTCAALVDKNEIRTDISDDLSKYIHIYPTIVNNDVVKVQFNFNENVPVTAQLIDINGRILKNYDITLAGRQIVELNVNNISNGWYILNFVASGKIHSQKIIINK